jgi:hypothetical protein
MAQNPRRWRSVAWGVLLAAGLVWASAVLASTAPASAGAPPAPGMPWWGWTLLLFAVTFAMGIVAVLGGVGGGVLFVPIVSGFFPFHLDFVRGCGLMVALSVALGAGPGLLKMRLASLRLALPMALVGSAAAVVGAMIGLALPVRVMQTALGVCVLGATVAMLLGRKSDYPDVTAPDRWSARLGIGGTYVEPVTGREVTWRTHRLPLGLLLFVGIGLMAGMFGLGAGWANVPVLNMVLGAPLKVSVATSVFLLSITDTSAVWVYLNRGSVLPIMVVPSVCGVMLGSFVGLRLLRRAKPAAVRWTVLILLAFAGLKALLRGLGLDPFG